MATIVLQVPEESLVTKVKQACKMLVGVTSVEVQRHPTSYLYDPETGKHMSPKAVKEIEKALNGEGITHYDSVDDMFNKLGIEA